MSAPRTNIETQARWHRWPLIGIAAAVLFGALMAYMITWDGTDDATGPREPAAQVDGRTGEVEPAAEVPADPPAAPERAIIDPSPQVDPTD